VAELVEATILFRTPEPTDVILPTSTRWYAILSPTFLQFIFTLFHFTLLRCKVMTNDQAKQYRKNDSRGDKLSLPLLHDSLNSSTLAPYTKEK
jgi:hypothetical protein